ncbi:MAG TPA: hypothetical protein VGQ17_17230 [Gemmatimonadales bacterium]|nr:hypothetical protein [Gemmatimonadales bacterium]
MRLALPLLLALQAGPPTVGDTVFIERTLGDVGGAVVRPQPWASGGLGRELGPAELRREARGAVVRYALVFWYPGDHTVTLPGPVLVRRDGRSDTLAASTARIRIASVLPANRRRSSLSLRPPVEAVPLAAENPLVPFLFISVTAAGLLVVALRWRRRRKPAPPTVTPPAVPTAELLERWAAAGEHRAALDGWARLLGRRLAVSRDPEETAALQRLLDHIAPTVFAGPGAEQLAGLCRRAARLAGSAT